MEGKDNRQNSIPLLVVCGPTSSGKTKLAVDLAKAFRGEVVGADSMQVYRGMDIGTAKPTKAEMDGIPHHLIDILEPEEEFSVAAYTSLAKTCIEDITARGKLAILAGGTGLYIHSLIDNLRFEMLADDPAVRETLERLYDERGPLHLWETLRECDPALAEKLHPNNRGRILRALEVYQLTGTPMSKWQERARSELSPYRLCMLGLSFADRQALYDRIDRRVDNMLEEGLLAEARKILEGARSKTAVQAIGYKELAGYLTGAVSLEVAVDNLKKQTRRYAKRQLTWLRRDMRIHWLPTDRYPGYETLLADACRIVRGTLDIQS